MAKEISTIAKKCHEHVVCLSAVRTMFAYSESKIFISKPHVLGFSSIFFAKNVNICYRLINWYRGENERKRDRDRERERQNC